MRRLVGGLIVACALACGGEEVTRYGGSAMNDAVPDSTGSLALTFYARTDTSFRGLLRVGAPLSGDGSAYAWFEGTELRIVTVASTDGDTIVWRSMNGGAELGGRFEVTGGPREGQGGTWRARLASGPPVAPATLRLPRPFPVPLTALWPLVVLGLAVAAAARWIRAAPVTAPTLQPTAQISPFTAGRSVSGIGGWLAFFVFAQCVALLIAIFHAVGVPGALRDGFRLGALIPSFRAMVVLESSVQLLIPILVVIGVARTVQRDRRAPRFWFAYLTASAAYLVIDLIAGRYFSAQATRLFGAANAQSAGVGGGSVATIRQILATLAWALYWTWSERVRATFGAAALDRAPVAGSTASAANIAPVSETAPT